MLISISKNGKHLGSIVATKVVCDPADDYLLFLDGNRTVAYFPIENIELENQNFDVNQLKQDFIEYQSNKV